ncbi:hypothetical protein AYO21_00965 [Fonsecaea monophora]|uniref:Metallo-beta-lactamase domain-containing protein n=1 Tax=Fonsecaea monophora TaxID=254056 RepID=A0A177FL08_9EURO|nr:hypothetical protein AYO21_00965 [Fonsecaea monophora]KAH0844494.1 hypothetical protein FOPE_09639 [Fonsecaea pedrosoi]OAG45003.1 hypothetical protein AYO21_00965 [Fonsecaea monophora]
MAPEASITIDTSKKQSPIRNAAQGATLKEHLPPAKSSQTYPPQTSAESAGTNASLFFVGTATTILEWEGLRLMTDPNFLHAGDHVHLGPGVRGTRKTNPAVDLHDLPHIDLVLLSHYHADHFDQVVEASLRRDLPILTTPHAHKHLTHKGHGEAFTAVQPLDAWESTLVNVTPSSIPKRQAQLRVTGMPGKHVGDGLVAKANDILGAIPPTNGWMLELGYTGDSSASGPGSDFECGYRIYISGDTLYVSELEKIPELYTHAGKPIDLMLIHLGGTTVPGPHMPLLMVTMDAEQGVKLVKLVQPEVTVPIHYDDYDVFLSPLSDFKDAITKAGLSDKVVYLDRGDEFQFHVR